MAFLQNQLEEKEKAGLEQVERLTEELDALRAQLKERLELTAVLPDLSGVTGQATKPEPPLLEREDGEVDKLYQPVSLEKHLQSVKFNSCTLEGPLEPFEGQYRIHKCLLSIV